MLGGLSMALAHDVSYRIEGLYQTKVLKRECRMSLALTTVEKISLMEEQVPPMILADRGRSTTHRQINDLESCRQIYAVESMVRQLLLWYKMRTLDQVAT